MRWRVVLLLCLAGVASAPTLAHPANGAARQSARYVSGFETFHKWAQLVRTHAPGAWDVAAQTVAAWPFDDLITVRTDLEAVAHLFASHSTSPVDAQFGTILPKEDGPRSFGIPQETRTRLPGGQPFYLHLSLEALPVLLGLTISEFSQNFGTLSARFDVFDPALRELAPAVIRVMEEAAMLHADIAALAPLHGVKPAAPAAHARSFDAPASAASKESLAVRIVDGQNAGLDDAPVHWEIARAALDAMRPDPAKAEPVLQFIQLWYRATSAYQLANRSYAYAGSNLEHARKKLVDDALIQMYSGVVEENQAAPPVQVAIDSMGLGANVRLRVAPAAQSLQLAEGYLRRAVDLDPSLAVALVHHARVTGLLARHEEAVGDLRRAMPSVTDPILAYYLQLFLGAEEQAIGHAALAREAFEQAAALFPRAQSPHLALSQLAWQHGNRDAALTAFGELARLPVLESERPDPWWTYDVSAVRDKGALAAELIALAARERGR